MRVLMTWTWPTHYLHMVPLGWALRAAGHEVRVASRPGHVAATVRSGLPAVAVGRDVDVMAAARRSAASGDGGAADERRWTAPHRERVLRAIGTWARVADAMVDDLLGFGRAWRPDLVVFDPMAYAGALAAAALDVPAARHLWGVDLAYGDRHRDPGLLGDVPEFGPLLGRLGLPGFDDLGDLTLDPFPPSLQIPAPIPRRTVRYVPYNGPGAEPDWTLAPPRRPRICVTWGTTGGQYAAEGYFHGSAAVAAAAELDVEVVVATTPEQRPLYGDLPDGVRVAESVPLHMLLRHCSAIVHQGGGGTTLTALDAGVRQLVVGHLPDHRLHGHKIAAAGAGIVREATGTDAAALRADLVRLLSEPRFGERTAALRAEVRAQPAPAAVVPDLERLAAGVPAGAAAGPVPVG
ncbi:nucleotide disphospho-sugar-binding domain-containing protein [Actinomadura sp. WAC 06369]|uniref:nucleotide disphospho-sugar-binding domain-containing protein n=1 Tax=Actinomadura sp. WAC 06369 TaxID=2203193 RepID=UPI000F76AE9B|nr:nucleotide disphospho-sugar-binding domain-containing protein [Actinomadura sp. WAC 06369]RSN70959.1 protein IroB [Actinomadura sp. WAC 06369]